VPVGLCPKCRFPLSRAESRAGKCPFCAAALGADDAARPRGGELPPPVDERAARVPASQAVKPLLRGAAILVMLAVGGGGLYYAVSAAVTYYLCDADTPADGVPHEPAKSAEAALAAPMPPTGGPSAAPPLTEANVEALLAPAQDVGGGRVRKIDSPQGEYVVEPLDGAVQVYLRGRVKTLRIGSLGGDVILDATGLEAQEVFFTGAISGRAKAKVHAPNGSVEFRASISGRASLGVDATGGRVTFPKPAAGRAGAEISGDPRMTIRAREVDFQVPINDDAQVLTVLSAGGKIRFTEMNGHSRLTYRKAEAGDPDPVIGWGIVRDEARFRETK